jgi:hypothetical protein
MTLRAPDLCRHYQPRRRSGCDAGYSAPMDCICEKHDPDAAAMSSPRAEDVERIENWEGEWETTR